MRLKDIIILQNKIDLVTEAAAQNQHEAIQKFIQGTIAGALGTEQCRPPLKMWSPHQRAAKVQCGRALPFSPSIEPLYSLSPKHSTPADGAPVLPISAQLKYNVDVVAEYIIKKIPVPVRDFVSPPQMIVIR